MSYEVQPTPKFEKQQKQLSKKYQSIAHDVANLIESLSENLKQGDRIKEEFL